MVLSHTRNLEFYFRSCILRAAFIIAIIKRLAFVIPRVNDNVPKINQSLHFYLSRTSSFIFHNSLFPSRKSALKRGHWHEFSKGVLKVNGKQQGEVNKPRVNNSGKVVLSIGLKGLKGRAIWCLCRICAFRQNNTCTDNKLPQQERSWENKYSESFLIPSDLWLETYYSNIIKLKGKKVFVVVHKEQPVEPQNKVKKMVKGT